nr:hypothetical protein [Tanacetum cinerariifolium]
MKEIRIAKNGDHPLPVVAQVLLAGTAPNAPPTLKDPKFWTAKEKKTRKIDRLARYLLIQGLPNDIYSLIDSNDTAKDLWDALKRQTKNLMDINIDALYNILKQNQSDVNDAMGYKKKAVVVTSDPLALVDEIIVLLAKVFNQKKYYAKPTNKNLRTSLASSSTNKKPQYVKSEEKKEDKKADAKKWDMRKVECYNCKKEGHFAKDYKKAKVKDYNYYKTKLLLAKKDSDEQVLLAEDQAWMESSSDSYQEINDNSTNYGLFIDNDDNQEIFHDAIEFASENFNKNHVVSPKDHDQSEVDHNDSKEKDHLVDKLIKKFNQKIPKCQKCIEKAKN